MNEARMGRQEWEDKYIEAMMRFEPRQALDDAWEDAWFAYNEHGHEDPVALARRITCVEEEDMPLPGWKFEGGHWRLDD